MIGVALHSRMLTRRIEPIAVRQAEVEEDEVRVPRPAACINPSCIVGCFDQSVLVRRQRRPQEAAHLRFILDQQDQRTLPAVTR